MQFIDIKLYIYRLYINQNNYKIVIVYVRMLEINIIIT